jgi:predicted GNAT family acetyltransferase
MTGGHYSHNPEIDRIALLELFDRQVRREAVGPPGTTVERDAETTLYIGDGWSALLWSDLDESNADAAIERVAARLRGLSGHAEWKLYGHDRPADLPERLRAAGFTPEAEEAVVVAEVAALPEATDADVRVATTPELVAAFVEVNEHVFGDGEGTSERALLQALEEEHPSMLAVVVFADGAPVSAARIDFATGSDFVGLYGGATLAEHRGRGYYRATVLERARLARERGYRFLQVDALPTSRPILERLGFEQITTTTPFIPGPAAASSD